MKPLRLGSRGSQLALFQASLVERRIKESGSRACEIIVIKTSGDLRADQPLSEIGGKRLFVKEIEDALLAKEIDLAVHSSKDMPVVLPHGLDLGAVLSRDDPADALILSADRAGGAHALPDIRAAMGPDARIGTGSVRRIAQLRSLFPDARFEDVRGNLDTRLRKLDSGDYDLLVLAAAGLRRLGLATRISMTVPFADCIPAPGQGIIAIEIRDDDEDTRRAVATVNDAEAMAALEAERALVVALGGGCQMPIGGLALSAGASTLELHAVVSSLDGVHAIRNKKTGPKAGASRLGRDVAEQLLRDGAADILKEARQIESRTPNPAPRQLT